MRTLLIVWLASALTGILAWVFWTTFGASWKRSWKLRGMRWRIIPKKDPPLRRDTRVSRDAERAVIELMRFRDCLPDWWLSLETRTGDVTLRERKKWTT